QPSRCAVGRSYGTGRENKSGARALGRGKHRGALVPHSRDDIFGMPIHDVRSVKVLDVLVKNRASLESVGTLQHGCAAAVRRRTARRSGALLVGSADVLIAEQVCQSPFAELHAYRVRADRSHVLVEVGVQAVAIIIVASASFGVRGKKSRFIGIPASTI